MTAAPLLVGCALHDGADIDACGCPALDSPGAIAYRGLLVKARAEIARITAELDAARAEVDCGQDGPCAKAPGCARHWQERNRELADELAAARAVPADVEAVIGLVDAIVEHARTLDSYDWQSRLDDSRTSDDAKDDARELSHALRDYDRSNWSTFLRTAIARAISDATAAAVDEFIDRHAKRLCEQAGYKWSRDDEDSDGEADDWASEIHDVLSHLRADKDLTIHDGRSAARGTVGGLLATRCCSKCRGISSHTPGGIPCDECGLVGSMPWGG